MTKLVNHIKIKHKDRSYEYVDHKGILQIVNQASVQEDELIVHYDQVKDIKDRVNVAKKEAQTAV